MLLLLAALQPIAPAWGDIKCWTNAEGNRECGDRLPPEHTQQGHEIRTEKGTVVRQVDKAATLDEINTLREQQRIEKERQLAEKEQQRMDEVLLSIFSEESDILRSQDEKVQILEGQITLAGERIGKLETRLEQIRKSIRSYEEKGQAVPPNLQQGEAMIQGQIDNNRRLITTKRTEQQQVIELHQAQLERFRELTSGGAPSPSRTTPP